MKKKTKVLIGISIILIIIIAVVGIIMLNQKEQLGTEWGKKYYEFLKDYRNSEKKTDENNNKSKIGFLEVEKVEDPVLVLNTEYEDRIYTKVCYIKNDKVKCDESKKGVGILYLYDIENKNYNYYVPKVLRDDNDKIMQIQYYSITEMITHEGHLESIIVPQSSKAKVDKYGREINNDSFSKKFIEIPFEDKYIDYDADTSDKQLKDIIKEAAAHKQTSQDIITKEVEQKVQNHLDDLKKKEENLKKEKEEAIKKQLQLQQQQKKQQEQLKESIQVGKYTLNYGTYKNSIVKVTINKDGSCHYSDADYKLDTSCTYKTESLSYGDFIIFNIPNDRQRYYRIQKNNVFSDDRAPLSLVK